MAAQTRAGSAVAEACLDAGLFREAALGIAESLLETKIRVRDGSLAWLLPDRAAPADKPARLATGADLYDGVPGIAIFLAAAARTEDRQDLHQAACEAILGWRRVLAGLAENPARAERIPLRVGGYTGIGSFFYSLATLARLLDQPELLAEAVAVSHLLTSRMIEEDGVLDLVGGAAGTLLALLNLERALPQVMAGEGQRLVERAEECAAHLLRQAATLPDGSAGWKTHPLYPEQTGYAHGCAGIARALVDLHRRTGKSEYLDLALRAFDFERSTFDRALGNWRDQTGLPSRGFQNQWCYGGPGIALGRIATLDLIDGKTVRQEIAAGLALADGPELAGQDHLCCGELGLVDVLAYAAERLDREELRLAAAGRAARLLERRARRGRFCGMVAASPYPDPSFLSGDAGIGYALLRLAHPGSLPCVLAME